MKQRAVDRPQLASPTVISLPQPPARNAEEYLKAYIGYIYTAVGAIAQEVASIDLHLYKAKFNRSGEPKITEVFEHPALSVLHYVNDLSTLFEVLEATDIYLELTGEAYWVVLKQGNIPTEFWLLRPDWVKVIPSPTKVIDHYDYYAGGVMTEKVSIPAENVIPFKYFNPLNPYRGKGATQAAALPFDILNFAQEYNRNFFFNSAIPSMVFSTDAKISEQAVKRFVAQWQASFGGRSKSNKVAFLGSGLKLDKASFGAKELDFNEQMKTMRDDVLAVFKVPKTVLGLTDDVNRANADSTTRAFMERVITPRMKRMVDKLNEFYLPMFEGGDNSFFFDFTDPSPEDVELKLKRYESGRKYTWLTPNEIRAEENLEPLPGGDDLFTTSQNTATEENPEDVGEGGEDDLNNSEDDTNVNEPTPADEEPSKPVDEEPKGFRAMVARMLGYKVIDKTQTAYVPPAYLKRMKFRRDKHMMRLPVKSPKQLQTEEMTASFVPILKTFIGDLIKSDNTKLPKKRGKKTELDKQITEVITKSAEEIQRKLNLEKAENDDTLHSDWNDEQKDTYWNAFSEKAFKDEKDILDTTLEIFGEQEKLILANLQEQNKSFRTQQMGKKAIPSGIVPSLADLNKMWGALELLLTDIYGKRGQEALDELVDDVDFNITTEFAVQYLEEYSGVLISEVNSTTRDAIRKTLAEGYDAGESIPKLAKRVKEVFAEAGSVRAVMIARTESIKASNSAAVEAYRQSGVVVRKEWLAQRDTRTCPFCLDLDGKAISLTSYFAKVGDVLTGKDKDGNKVEMEVKYTDIGEPPAHVSCRCTPIPVVVK